MTEVIIKSADGDRVGNTSGVQTVKAKYDLQPQRVTIADLDGPIGGFLGEALCAIAPNAFRPSNWKSKLSSFVTSKTTSFIYCGRAVGLAHVEMDVMSGENEAVGLFCLAGDGGTEEDVNFILRTQKQWARDMGIGFRPPLKDYSSLSQSKIQVLLKAEKREELIVLPLAKKG